MRPYFILISVALVMHNTSQQESGGEHRNDGEPKFDTDSSLTNLTNVESRDTGRDDGEPDYDATDDTKSRVARDTGRNDGEPDDDVSDDTGSRALQTRGLRCFGVPSTHWSCCSSTHKCGVDQGDCDSDSDCSSGLICGTNNCQPKKSGSNWHNLADCCVSKCSQASTATWNCCSSSNPCDVGGGDCDSDSECSGNLRCGNDNCQRSNPFPGWTWHSLADCCTSPGNSLDLKYYNPKFLFYISVIQLTGI